MSLLPFVKTISRLFAGAHLRRSGFADLSARGAQSSLHGNAGRDVKAGSCTEISQNFGMKTVDMQKDPPQKNRSIVASNSFQNFRGAPGAPRKEIVSSLRMSSMAWVLERLEPSESLSSGTTATVSVVLEEGGMS